MNNLVAVTVNSLYVHNVYIKVLFRTQKYGTFKEYSYVLFLIIQIIKVPT